MSVTGDVADAVAAELNDNDADFGVEFTAKRKWVAKWELKELATLRVSAVPGPVAFRPLDRRRDDQVYDVDVVVQKKLARSLADGRENDANAEIDPLVELMEAIVEHFREQRVEADGVPLICNGRQFVSPGQAAVDGDLLQDPKVFTGVVRITLRRLK